MITKKRWSGRRWEDHLFFLYKIEFGTIPFSQITTIDDDEAIKLYVFENYNQPLYKIVLNARKM